MSFRPAQWARRVAACLLSVIGCGMLLHACGGSGDGSDVSGGGSGSAPPAGLSIETGSGWLHVNQTRQLTARIVDASGSSTPATDRVTWHSSDDRIGAFDQPASPGLLSARTVGTFEVTASLDGVSARAVITVVPAPAAVQQPLRVSTANPRYFEREPGMPILLAGSHTWVNLQDNGTSHPPAPFDYEAFLRFLSDHGHNFFRLWAWEQSRWVLTVAEDQNWIAPSPFERTGPGLALDGLPKFDLTRFNQAYFDRLRQRVEQAGERGIYVSVMLFNGFSVAASKPSSPPGARSSWRGHPFNSANNINGINGDPNGDGSGEETHELVVPAVTAIQEAYVRKVIDTLNDLDNVLYEISNESHANSQAWQYHIIDLVHAYEAGKPKQHPVGMTVEWPNGSNDELFASRADWISPSGEISSRPVATGAKVIIADTDHLCGVCGDRGWVWRSFTAGENPVLMDPYDRDSVVGAPAELDFDSPALVGARRNMGYAIQMSHRMDLARALPQPALASTGHCLADLTGPAPTLLAYLPNGGEVTVDLRQLPETSSLQVEWLRPETGSRSAAGTTAGGARRTFRAPFPGDAVLFLFSAP